MKSMKKQLLALAVFAAMATPFAALADTSNMNVTASVVGTCRFTATPDAAFGPLDPALGTDKSATSAVQFWCTKGSTYAFSVGNGANFNTGTSTRQMRGPLATDLIPYSVTPVTATGSGTGKSTPITVNLTGTVLGTNYINASVGAYSDVVQLVITP